ncbi:amidase signature domain-containing protein [Annulohypoxylon bovei var. microspora]|nr:amidase signature domain-containing protein [Annulohypoxylon bovei var. microspora]
MKSLQLSAAFMVLLSSVARCAQTVSKQVNLGANSYFLPPTKSWSFQSWKPESNLSSDEFLPLTVVRLNSSSIDARDLRTIFELYNATDDVWTPEFTKDTCSAVLFDHPGNKFEASLTSSLEPDYAISNIFDSSSDRPDISNVPRGPYFLQTRTTGYVYRAYKLVDDVSQAFIQSSYQDENNTHHTLAAASMSAGALTIGIPSRLYYTRTSEKPLAGLRLAVKDLYDLRGLKTSGGNRALYEMHQFKNATALPVQKLIDAGAVVIGKNHLSEFAYAGTQVPEHVDYVLPFNPRGDGYSSPGDSSGGSGAAVASYDFLDVSMGGDTGGSIRGPAIANGVMGNRPSTGAVDLSFGVLPLSPAMDTSGVIVRDPAVWSDVNKVLYSGFAKEYPSFPKKIYIDAETAQYYSNATGDDALWWSKVQDFVKALSKLLDAKVTELSIDSLWNSTSSAIPRIGGSVLSTTVDYTYLNLTTYDQWNDFGREYSRSWMDTHDGEFPPMVPHIRQGWLQANESITDEIHQQNLDTVRVLRQWVSEEFLRPDNATCSDAIFLYFSPPSGSGYKPDISRDGNNVYMQQLLAKGSQLLVLANAQLNATLLCNESKATNGSNNACEEARAALQQLTSSSPSSVMASRFASVAGIPDFAITLGEMATENTNSAATMKPQAMPWAVDIVAGRKCDFMLQDLVSAMAREGIVKPVKTGKHVL